MAFRPMISAKALGAMPQFVFEVAGERRLEKAMDAAGLPFHFIDERAGYISEHSLATFIHEAARSAGRQNIGLLWSSVLTVADYGAWGEYVLSAPTLEAALCRASAAMPYHASTDRAWLERADPLSRFCYGFGLRTHHAYADMGFSAIGAILSIFRAYLGPGWFPAAVLLDFPKVPGFTEAEDVFACPVIWDAPRLAVVFETSCLHAERSVGCRYGPTTIEDIWRERRDGAPRTVSGQVTALLWHQLYRHDTSIDATARSLGVGVRTLQRRLEAEGVRFRRLVNDVRVARAKELLSLPTETVSGIASALGYETANNFSRAFKSATGASPSEYRRRIVGPGACARDLTLL
ncbi:AraC family transcriptional regulator ligand-binding domain-containing protein [Lutimaribacter marinistellae]|uniref:AraC family transcriptional regulator ligand-binding domain-containing protein n=1 Tax=Lutimaribacter marinistellae TaxID=1820329 RepID=A0ABV7TAC0_9RHOB